MSLHLRQNIAMKQELTQTPQQILRSELLQLPMMVLETRLKLEMEENPVLEVEEGELDLQDLVSASDDGSDDDSDDAEDNPIDDDNEVDWDQFADRESLEMQQPLQKSSATTETMEIPRPAMQTLQEHLTTQLQLDKNLSWEDQRIGMEIIGNLQQSGYLGCETGFIAAQMGTDEEHVIRVLKQIHFYEPPGIGARNLQECLLIQATVDPDMMDTARMVLRDYFDDFINKRYETLARQLKIDLDEVKQVFLDIARLNPRPGEGAISELKTNFVIPDLIVEKVDGEFIVTLNDGSMPALRISRYYMDMLRNRNQLEKNVKDFLVRKVESANWFLDAIQQRRQTMLKVMRAIVNQQVGFFNHGKDHLKPMILRDIAEEVEMDISVISRVTNGKYVQTEWGVFELKYFFSERITSSNGEDVSTKVIRQKIRDIIAAEDKKKPYSDQKVSELLKQEGFAVARRTIQKYREQMKIPIKKLRREI